MESNGEQSEASPVRERGRRQEGRHAHEHGPVPAVLQRSRFAHLLQREGVSCVFHSLHLRMVYGGAMLAELFRAFAGPRTADQVVASCAVSHPEPLVRRAVADLFHKGLLVAGADADSRAYWHQYHRALGQYRIQHVYVLPTSACNFQCTYCFVEDRGRRPAPCQMSRDTAEKALTAFARLTRESGHASITFYGGEPLLNPDTTFFALRLLRRLEAEGRFPESPRISVLTNGSLVDETAIRAFQETRPSVGVSIDGPQALHDAARVTTGGAGTFQAALRGYRMLQDAGIGPSVSCTLNALTLSHVDEIVDFVIDELKPAGMGFNLLLPQSGAGQVHRGFDHEAAVPQLIRAFERLRAAGIYEDRMMRRVRPFMACQLHCKDCMGVGGQLVITPDGRVGPCQAFLGVDDERYFPLHVDDLAARGDRLSAADIYGQPLFGEWCQRFPLNMRQCTDCAAISVCGGGCPYAAQIASGSIWEVDERICPQASGILEWMIWDTYRNMQRAEDPPRQGHR